MQTERSWRAAGGQNVKAIFVISPEQDAALRKLAFARASEAGSRKPDASAVLREVLDAWLKKSAR